MTRPQGPIQSDQLTDSGLITLHTRVWGREWHLGDEAEVLQNDTKQIMTGHTWRGETLHVCEMELAKSEQQRGFSKFMLLGPPGTVKCLDLMGRAGVGE